MSLGPEAPVSDETTPPTADPAVERGVDEKVIAGRSLKQIAWRRLKRDKVAIAGGIVVIVLIILALIAPLLTHLFGHPIDEFHNDQIDPTIGTPIGKLGGISRQYILGVEPTSGRDIFSRILYGAQTSLSVAFLSAFVSTILGVIFGLSAGYLGGWVDAVISRVMDFLLAFPQLLFAIALVSVLPATLFGLGGRWSRVMVLVGVIGFFGWPYIGRIVRGQTLSLREREFVEASKSLGARSGRILFRELLPNLAAPILVYTTLIIPTNRWGRLQANHWLGGLAELHGDHERAAELHRDGLRWAEDLLLEPEVAAKLSWLAWLAVQTRDYAEGRELAGRAYRMALEQDSPTAIVFAEISLGIAARRDGKLDVAVAHLSRIAEQGRAEAQPALYLPMVLVELGYAAEQEGDREAGLALHLEAYAAADAMGAPRDAIGALEGMASAVDRPEVAARLLGAAAAARRSARVPAAPAERDETDRVTDRLVAALGLDRFGELLAEGGRLSPGQARALI
jgi:peptide/nickel transport system permease protein